MALALNNLKRVDMPLNKETNQTKVKSGKILAESPYFTAYKARVLSKY